MLDSTEKKIKKRVLVTGGAGFIGGWFIKRLLDETEFDIFNIDKMSYCSNLEIIQKSVYKNRHNLIEFDLLNKEKIFDLIEDINPDYIFHFAAESHVDRSIMNPTSFVENNILSTLNLLEASLNHYKKLSQSRKSKFIFFHISTDEVFGSLNKTGKFNESSKYDPSSPYSASKSASDHLVKSWFITYGLPIIISNCSNNFGPYQFPEKLIPLTIINGINNKPLNIFGNGSNIRDWLYVEDHIDAILLCFFHGNIGDTYCIGGNNEKTNLEIVKKICLLLDKKINREESFSNLITFVKDRPGHDLRYAIDSSKMNLELGWSPKNNFDFALEKTIDWYLGNMNWSIKIMNNSNYYGNRLGI